jgi:hypothetical protein
VAGRGAEGLEDSVPLTDVEWRKLGADWLLLGKLGADS